MPTSSISSSHAAIWGLQTYYTTCIFPFSHDWPVRICIDVFLYDKKEEKNTLFMETAMYSMMNVVFRLKEGECNDWCAKEQKATQFDWIQLIYNKHNEGADLPLLSSNKLFCLTHVSYYYFFYFKGVLRTAQTQRQTLSVPLMKALAVCCHCKPRGVDDQHQLRLRRMKGICAWPGWWGWGLRCLKVTTLHVCCFAATH